MKLLTGRACVTAAAFSALLIGCGTVDENTEFADLAAVGGWAEAEQALYSATEGVFTTGEADCILDAMMKRPGITVGEVVAYSKKPDPDDPLATVYAEIVPTCIDAEAVVEPAPLAEELGATFIAAIRLADPSITEEQAGCLLEELLAGELTPRVLMLSGYDDQVFTSEVEPRLLAAADVCF